MKVKEFLQMIEKLKAKDDNHEKLVDDAEMILFLDDSYYQGKYAIFSITFNHTLTDGDGDDITQLLIEPYNEEI